MSHNVNLCVYKRPVDTLFGCRDQNEKSLTYLLGYMIVNSDQLRKKILKELNIKINQNDTISVDIEHDSGPYGRPDICILINDKPRALIEGKIFTQKIGLTQCRKYIKYLRKNQTLKKQSLLLIYDWFNKDYMEKEKERLIKNLDKSLNSKQKINWRISSENYLCSPKNWDDIHDWCKSISKRKLGGEEKKLIIDYEKYLESERYRHAQIGKPINEPKQKLLKSTWTLLEKIAQRYNDNKVKLTTVPSQGQKNPFYYEIQRTKKHIEGYFGYKRATSDIFGLIFQGDRKTPDVYLYIVLTDRLIKKIKHQKDFSQFRDNIKKYGKEWWFPLDQQQAANELISKLDQHKYFYKVITG